MTAKQYLQNYKRIERNYKLVIESIKSIEKEMICLKSPSFEENFRKSAKNDPIGDMVISLDREKGRLSMKLIEYRGKMSLIKTQIDCMEQTDNDYYVILLFRYVLYKDWKYICDNLNLSRAQANVIHGRALRSFDEKFGKIYNEK